MRSIPSFVVLSTIAVAVLNWEACDAQSNLFLHGGGVADTDQPILRKFVKAAGGIGTARIAVITMASELAVENGEFYTNIFLESDAAATTWIPLTMDNSADLADDPAIADLIRGHTGVFFGGGDQGRIISGLIHPDGSDTLVLQAIREVFALGAVGGTSAGTACQSDGLAIAGGRSFEAWAYPICTVDCETSDDLSFYEAGLGFAYKIITDSHFGERCREGRLIKLLLEANDPEIYGVGVDESTALLFWNVGSDDEYFEVVGNAGGATLVDTFAARYDPSGPSVTGVRLTYLSEGDTGSLITGNVQFAPWKTDLAGNELNEAAYESTDIFREKTATDAGEFRYAATQLFDSRVRASVSTTHNHKPGFEVSMKKDASSVGYGGYSPTTSKFVISYANLRVDIEPLA